MVTHAHHADRCRSRPLRAVQICPQHHLWSFGRTPPGSLWRPPSWFLRSCRFLFFATASFCFLPPFLTILEIDGSVITSAGGRG